MKYPIQIAFDITIVDPNTDEIKIDCIEFQCDPGENPIGLCLVTTTEKSNSIENIAKEVHQK
jgi:hypothetical protein